MRKILVGIDFDLEAEADRLLHESMAGVTKHSEKSDVLTPWKERDRRSREVLVSSPDPSVLQGTFTRAYNPQNKKTNSREGLAGLLPQRPAPLSAYMQERQNLQTPGEGVTCNGWHSQWPESCARHCQSARYT